MEGEGSKGIKLVILQGLTSESCKAPEAGCRPPDYHPALHCWDPVIPRAGDTEASVQIASHELLGDVGSLELRTQACLGSICLSSALGPFPVAWLVFRGASAGLFKSPGTPAPFLVTPDPRLVHLTPSPRMSCRSMRACMHARLQDGPSAVSERQLACSVYSHLRETIKRGLG